MMRKEPGLREDFKNLTLIGASACAAALITAGVLYANFENSRTVRIHVVDRVEAPDVDLRYEVVTPLSGSNRLYGTVTTRGGEEFTGYLRWDRNEASWSDLLDANKPNERGGESISGIRFGHVDRMVVESGDAARFTLKSGAEVLLTGNATDLGNGLRALLVDGDEGLVELSWNQLSEIDFLPPPSAHPPREGRLFGTLTTRDGLSFTGFVSWDVDEVYSSDVLDGDLRGQRLKIPFGAVQSIERNGSRSARVTLHGGEELVLDGTNDVDASNRGISVSDPALGQIKLGWDDFDRVEFHGADAESAFADFDGGARLEGTVTTVDGETLSGLLRWDRDEAFTWEMLNGEIGDIEFNVEFGNVASIEKTGDGARVTLRDGRVLELEGSNDVDSGNRGIAIGDGERIVRWADFRELRLKR